MGDYQQIGEAGRRYGEKRAKHPLRILLRALILSPLRIRLVR
jgi:hypothetical protein